MIPKTTTQFQPVVTDRINEYANNVADQFMATSVLPIYVSKDKTAILPKLPIGNVTKSTGNLKRASKSGYERIEFNPETFTFLCEMYGIEEPIDNYDKAYLADFIGNLVDDGQLRTLMLLRQQEKRVAALAFNASTFAGYTGSVGTEWDVITSKIVDDVQDGILTLKQNVGGVLGMAEINLSLSEKVFRNMMKNTQIQSMRGGKNGASRKDGAPPISAEEMAMILGVAKVNYSPAQDNATDIWDDEYALLHLSYAGKSIRSVAHIGRTIQWEKVSRKPFISETYESNENDSMIHRVKHSVDEVIFTPAAGYLFANITT